MNIKYRITAAAAAAIIALAGTAGAATLDFVAEAAGDERGVADGTVLTFDGLNVEFSAAHVTGTASAYFDDLSSGKPAGLGVCQVLTDPGAQCNPSSDDNITSGESVTLMFDKTLTTFQVTSFYDANHNSLAGSDKTLLINGSSVSFADALATDYSGVASITFAYGGTNADQFYVGGAIAAIPLPAAGFLMLGGLGGLMVVRRRRKAA